MVMHILNLGYAQFEGVGDYDIPDIAPVVERVWNNPNKYIDKLKKYKCVLSPDFSLYGDMPVVAHSSMWYGSSEEALFRKEWFTMLKTLKPTHILVYGNILPMMEKFKD